MDFGGVLMGWLIQGMIQLIPFPSLSVMELFSPSTLISWSTINWIKRLILRIDPSYLIWFNYLPFPEYRAMLWVQIKVFLSYWVYAAPVITAIMLLALQY